MRIMYISFLLLLVFNLFTQEVEEDWINYYDGYSARGSEVLVTDSTGEFIYISGAEGNIINTMKIDPAGNVVWEESFIFPGSCYAAACEIKMDQFNNIYVSGYCDNWSIYTTNYVVIKYDQDGNELWATVCDYVDYLANSIVWLDIDEQQNVYVATRYATGNTISDYLIIKYDINGVEQWHTIHDGIYCDDVPSDIVVDDSGNIFVIGLSEMADNDYDFLLQKYNPSGDLQWEERYNSHVDYSYLFPRIALDHSGNICLIGMQKIDDQDYNIVIMKFDQFGNTMWTQSYNGTYQNSWDKPVDLVIDNENNIHILGSVQNEYSYTDMVILKFSPEGDLIWEEIYSSENSNVNDYAAAITLDIHNNVYITGLNEYCFRTNKYNPEGESLWSIHWEGPDSRYDAYVKDIVINNSGDVFVLGYNNYTAITLAKYIQPGFTDISNNNVPEIKTVLYNYPNPFNPSTTITFSLGTENSGSKVLEIFNMRGQKIKQYLISHNQSSIIWDGTDANNQSVSSGIYYSVIKDNGKNIASRKMLLMK